MNGPRGLWRFLALGLVFIAAAQLAAAAGAHVQAQGTAQTVATVVVTATVTSGTYGGTKTHCTSGLVMGECPSTSPGISMGTTGGLPSTGAGGTATNVVPARLPRTGGAQPGSGGNTPELVLGVLLLAAGLTLAGWARRSAPIR
jgi:hypothetical protein